MKDLNSEIVDLKVGAYWMVLTRMGIRYVFHLFSAYYYYSVNGSHTAHRAFRK
jgi:hypothetical protein